MRLTGSPFHQSLSVVMGKWKDTLALSEIPKDMGNAEALSCRVLFLHREGFQGARVNYFQSKEPSREPNH